MLVRQKCVNWKLNCQNIKDINGTPCIVSRTVQGVFAFFVEIFFEFLMFCHCFLMIL